MLYVIRRFNIEVNKLLVFFALLTITTPTTQQDIVNNYEEQTIVLKEFIDTQCRLHYLLESIATVLKKYEYQYDTQETSLTLKNEIDTIIKKINRSFDMITKKTILLYYITQSYNTFNQKNFWLNIIETIQSYKKNAIKGKNGKKIIASLLPLFFLLVFYKYYQQLYWLSLSMKKLYFIGMITLLVYISLDRFNELNCAIKTFDFIINKIDTHLKNLTLNN